MLYLYLVRRPPSSFMSPLRRSSLSVCVLYVERLAGGLCVSTASDGDVAWYLVKGRKLQPPTKLRARSVRVQREARYKSVGGPVEIIRGPDLQTGRSTRIGWGGDLNQNRLYLVDPQQRSPGPLPYLSGVLNLFTGPLTDLHRPPGDLDRAPHSFTPGPRVSISGGGQRIRNWQFKRTSKFLLTEPPCIGGHCSKPNGFTEGGGVTCPRARL